MSTPRILFIPLSNVLGHLTRTFSLAGKFLDIGLDVHVAAGVHYAELLKSLPAGITTHAAIEMPVSSITSLGSIKSYGIGEQHDLANLEDTNSTSAETIEIASRYLKLIVDHDKKLIKHLQPDIIITDYRFTTTALPLIPAKKVFHISNVLGFPSFYNRVRGKCFTPLDTENVLVPGIQAIELHPDDKAIDNPNLHWCGHFKWDGWKKNHPNEAPIPEADVFLCFGSTGNAAVVIPWLVDNLSTDYQLLLVVDNAAQAISRENLLSIKFGSLEQCLKKSRVVCCHGGHGTVMECILQEKPMLIFPNNLEQLEIGRRVEKLGLGILINKPLEMLDKHYLNDNIRQLHSSNSIRKNLKHYSQLLKQHNGPDKAASVIMKAL